MMLPRPEYPRPQMQRAQWLNLNGYWEFETDPGKSGRERGLPAIQLTGKILVPFCPESELSGINNKDFMPCVWYARPFTLPNWQKGRVLLHIGACDYHTEVFVNGVSAGEHIGGYTSFSFDITPLLQPGENRLAICATDELRLGGQPAGKQSVKYSSYACSYTRTTGIWQTVWLEGVPEAYISSTKYSAMPEQKALLIEAVCENAHDMVLSAEAFSQGTPVGSARATVQGKLARLLLPLSQIQYWQPGNPHLYGLRLSMGQDAVDSYFGYRTIVFDGKRFLLNGSTVFQRLVLDQGYYPDGIYTAPTDEALERDILLAMEAGFNGARLHQKIFEPRFLYHCDRLGYLVWGEHANWGLDITKPEAWQGFLPEWLEALQRDYNHPSIIGWCPLNEAPANKNPLFVRLLASLTRAVDSTRPFIECSGGNRVPGTADLQDSHDYDQNPETLALRYAPLPDTDIKCPFTGEMIRPVFISEYGGARFNQRGDNGWGYGMAPMSLEEFYARFAGLTGALLQNPHLAGFCYTQLYDVEQEQNGLYTYQREQKFSLSPIRAALTAPAAIEAADE